MWKDLMLGLGILATVAAAWFGVVYVGIGVIIEDTTDA
jgi:hypothetical protein